MLRLKLVFLEATVGPGTPATVDLRPNTTYVAAAGARVPVLTTFTTGFFGEHNRLGMTRVYRVR